MALSTEAGLRDVERELAEREPVFHRTAFATTPQELEAATDPDFFEVGASGRVHERRHVLEVVARRYADGVVDDGLRGRDFHCRRLAPDLFQLSYALTQGARETRRTSLWRRAAEGWRIVHHQGTVVEAG
ncbi:nuclear transport factor 2 family protein [Pseudonocardia humida]|uniref:DUF4440 domain-containing protein n=1 Tax=Pseudonocardia humida TaxID=2800819 RepID=A0ABT0ZVE4_9PSEU|nr:DUF4440 domain-containing protein [Pseudonocardia humida]MCO1654715.1 DUF4440 domain-containing protein [Pseudonocardia humida]